MGNKNVKPLTDKENWCKTTVGETIKSRFLWTIEGLKTREEEEGQWLDSDSFKICDPEGKVTTWYLRLYPRGFEKTGDEDDDDEDCVAIVLFSNANSKLKINVEMFLLVARKHSIEFEAHELSRKIGNGGIAISRDDLLNWIPDDNLTISCDITLYGSGKTVSGCKYVAGAQKIKQVTTESCQQELSQDLQKLLFDKDLADVEIICGDKSLPCHTIVLSARSPVFRAMFKAEMTEKKRGKVEIQGFSSDVIQNMLHFIYTGMLSKPDLDEAEAEDLLGAEDQYQLDLLKRVCENKLCELLNVDNCLRLLAIADMHQADRLKALAIELVVKNMDTIVIKGSEDWKKCVKNHPDLVVQITEEQAKRNGV